MAAPGVLRPVAAVAAINFALQGLVGVVLCILALCVCFCSLGPAPSSSGNDLSQFLTSYFQGDECGGTPLYSEVTGSTALRVWMCLALFFSASMCASSFVLAAAVLLQWSDEKLQITLVSWLFINALTSIDDVILGYVFSSDYAKVLNNTTQEYLAPLALGVIAFLAMRGFYLWIFNVTLIVYLASCARSLHLYLNTQVRSRTPVTTGWPSTMDDFGKTKRMPSDIERTAIAVNPLTFSERGGVAAGGGYPDHSALARWPTLNGQPPTMRDDTRERPGADHGEQRHAHTMREWKYKRQAGIDNEAFERDVTGFLQNDVEYYENKAARRRGSESGQWDQMRREIGSIDSTEGHYRQRSLDESSSTWTRTPPPTPQGYINENGIPIPPPDYQDLHDLGSVTHPDDHRPLSLKEAILDRTIRLKKVPEELKRRIHNK